ncbi:hypothetical protein [Nonomuraea soli]|uniref:Uncharacterized protein n=1 Tax=Nonomuraea soli TaxID=1032476 RepID=A0A7W0CQS4_9ACTN|nr:hypothetical protein [Nonomuraea soli]MBA2895560.1 hypothetical protein [Nonomuraea soli]
MIERMDERVQPAWVPRRDYYEAVTRDPVMAVLDIDGEGPRYLLAVRP